MLELIFTTLYCLIGLALISMGISLMQEQVSAKVEWIAGKIFLFLSEKKLLHIYLQKIYVDVTIFQGKLAFLDPKKIKLNVIF